MACNFNCTQNVPIVAQYEKGPQVGYVQWLLENKHFGIWPLKMKRNWFHVKLTVWAKIYQTEVINMFGEQVQAVRVEHFLGHQTPAQENKVPTPIVYPALSRLNRTVYQPLLQALYANSFNFHNLMIYDPLLISCYRSENMLRAIEWLVQGHTANRHWDSNWPRVAPWLSSTSQPC